MNDPLAPTPDFDARVAELATGFALGDLDETELKELYELLRDEQGHGTRAARVAWQTLGMVTDLRAEVGSTFQDTLAHRLSNDRSGRFASRLWQRLGFRAPSLMPVEAPPPSAPRFTTWTVLAVVTAALVVGSGIYLWSRATTPQVTVAALYGSATIAGTPLLANRAIDHRTVVVKPGGQLTLAWSDGSSVVIAGGDDASGEAVATVRSNGLSLLRGRAWLDVRQGFSLTLPDRAVRAGDDHTSFAAEVIDQRSFIGVRHGEITGDRLERPLGEHAGTGPSGTFRWQWEWDAAHGTIGNNQGAPPDWRLGADVVWSDTADALTLSCTGVAASSAPTTTGTGEVALRFTPGLLVVTVDGRELQRLNLAGSPLLGFRLDVRQRERKTLGITVGELSLMVPLAAPLDRYALSTTGGAMIKIDTFHPLPSPRPPQPAAGW